MATRLILSCGVVFFCFAAGGEVCSTCGDEPNFPEAATFLAAHGYAAKDYETLLTWSEQSQDGSGKFVSGFHVKPVHGDAAFDLYSDDAGNLLSDARLSELGIVKKQWNLPPAEVAAGVLEAGAKALPERPMPVGPSIGLGASGAIVLPPIDLQEVLQENAAPVSSGGKGGHRIGVFQEIDPPIQVNGEAVTCGAWQPVPGGGWLWSTSITSPDALGIRVHFAVIQVPAGAQVVVYNESNPAEAVGPYLTPAKNGADLWSNSCFTDMVVVECSVPPGADLGQVRISIDKITHQYVAFADMGWAKALWPQEGAAGACNNDVTCYSEWASVATGIAGYDGVDSGGAFFCSGTLLADAANSGTPYFLTANHCVSTAGTAATLEFFWLFQTSACNGSPPPVASIPMTHGGANLLTTTSAQSGTDFCLLRLNTKPPGGVSYVGWSSAAAAVGTAVASIHHPSADYKRISFGDTATNTSFDTPANHFYEIDWTSGVTEAGSSGGPLLTVSKQQVVGQLYGGLSGCGEPASQQTDFYGRFDQTFPLVATYLSPAQKAAAPNVVGMTEANAESAIVNAGFSVGTITEQASGSVAVNDVISQQPTASAQVALGSPIDLVVSSGSPASTGSLTVTILPQAAIAAGAQWRVDSGAWQASGATVADLVAGSHTITFSDIASTASGCAGTGSPQYTTPAAQTATIVAGQTAQAAGTYATAKAALAFSGGVGSRADMLVMALVAGMLFLMPRVRHWKSDNFGF